MMKMPGIVFQCYICLLKHPPTNSAMPYIYIIDIHRGPDLITILGSLYEAIREIQRALVNRCLTQGQFQVGSYQVGTPI